MIGRWTEHTAVSRIFVVFPYKDIGCIWNPNETQICPFKIIKSIAYH